MILIHQQQFGVIEAICPAHDHQTRRLAAPFTGNAPNRDVTTFLT
jgi:hypothetical protein